MRNSPIFFRFMSLAVWQKYTCTSAIEAIPKNISETNHYILTRNITKRESCAHFLGCTGHFSQGHVITNRISAWQWWLLKILRLIPNIGDEYEWPSLLFKLMNDKGNLNKENETMNLKHIFDDSTTFFRFNDDKATKQHGRVTFHCFATFRWANLG